jgi:hypothetical protein
MIVLIHVHEGTIISSWQFQSAADADAFQNLHRSEYRDEDARCYLPDGTFDDPGSDTWITVEGEQIARVDGDAPEFWTP